jgi:hypothetical protein
LLISTKFVYFKKIPQIKELKMIAKNIKILEKYCKDYKNIENYEDAVRSPLIYDLHHRLEISEMQSRSDLIFLHLYYNRPPKELVFLEHREHVRLHNAGKQLSTETRQKMSIAKKGENNPMFSKNLSAETRQKMSTAQKGENNPMFGKNMSAETRKRMSEAHKGLHWHLENGHRIWTE